MHTNSKSGFQFFSSIILPSLIVTGIVSIGLGFNMNRSIKHEISERLKSYRWDQIKFSTTKIFRFSMDNKAADNLVGSITFDHKLTECILLAHDNKVLARYGDCWPRYNLSLIPEGFSNFNEFIAIKTNSSNNNSVISFIHNPENLKFDKNQSFVLPLGNYNPFTDIVNFVWIGIVFLSTSIFMYLSDKYRQNQSSQQAMLDSKHDSKQVNDNSISILKRIDRAFKHNDTEKLSDLITLFKNYLKVNKASLYNGDPIIEELSLVEVIQPILSTFCFKRNDDWLSTNLPDYGPQIIACESYLSRSVLNILSNAYTNKINNGKVYISIIEGVNYTELIIANDGTIKKPNRIAERGYTTGISSGIGVPIIIESLKRFNASIHYTLTDCKVIASIRLRKAKGKPICLSPFS